MKTTGSQMVIIEKLEGDTLTPISIYQKLKGAKKFLLESSLKHEASGRYSIIGSDPVFELIGNGAKTTIVKAGSTELYEEKALELVKKLLPIHDIDLPFGLPINAGAVGYVGYDNIRQYENIGPEAKDELQLPDVHLLFFEDFVIFDHLEQSVYLVASPLCESTTEASLKARLEKRKQEIEASYTEVTEDVHLSAFKASVTKDEFVEKVKKAKEYITEGDIFQVVPSQRMSADFKGSSFSYYRKLRVKNQSPYMYYLDFVDYAIVGSSPESLIKATDGTVITNPIAGTRPRGKSIEEDQALEADLLQDEKELAEHKMLVDLARNDVGKVSQFGSINIDKYMKVEKYKHVMHIVSEVSGQIKDGQSSVDALISCLPAGTVSGAPKIRAMQIINELEGVKRGIYSGAVGYFSQNGNMDFALAIRTMVIKDNKAYIQAGAGIVHDSVPEKEYDETIHKLKVFLEGLS
ncbi:anthranilate synthase component I [Niallia taxi]|uniref:anthranilate synthase component I n=1 Tax=Niallia taxi TaxID=2499688 RepID=UPI0021A6AC24|nr:anthranilate synthase component I [Niallia taxi]MCT2346423.1 anthranilate synthase component I [Niallia taxi]MDE5053345.1 anthranilate synthase component I [Niallia taxi]MED3963365.1 anthranilate synthase component I [Niallia taxi]WOD61304.1 anthranilate synthase component I [Niallia taxi]